MGISKGTALVPGSGDFLFVNRVGLPYIKTGYFTHNSSVIAIDEPSIKRAPN
jgi:hypothetical protein